MSDRAARLALALVDAMPDGLVGAAGDGSIVFWSRGAERLLGYARDEVLGRALADVLPAERAGAGGGLPPGSGPRSPRGRHPHRTERPVEITWRRVETEDGPLTLATIRDAGEPRGRRPADDRADAAPGERARRARLAAVGQLAGQVSHALRNPLGVINNSVYYLRLVLPEEPRYQKHLEILQREVATATRLVSGLVDFARIGPAAPAPTDLNGLVREALGRVTVPDAVRVVIELAADPPVLSIDGAQIEAALGHLVANALEAMPDGGTLTVRTARTDDGALLSVADTGRGIAPEHLDRIFEPLFTTSGRGIGLGLPAARDLVEANGGRLAVASVAGRGSRFDLRFPAPAPAARAGEPPQRAGDETGGAPRAGATPP